MQSLGSPLDVIRSVRFPLTGLRIVDVGCGGGGMVKTLLAEGADACGVDPGEETIQRARAAVQNGTFHVAGAEALPFGDSSVDIVLMVNSLHHVPKNLMKNALSEAMRVIRPDGVAIIHEPLAEGTFFAALRPIEDETAVRRAAQQAIDAAVRSGLAIRKGVRNYIRKSTFADTQQFLDFVIAVDATRRAAIDRDKDAITANVLAAAGRGEHGVLHLDQPVKVDILGRP